MPPKQQLSKGTLGLKFMNRALPAASSPTTPQDGNSTTSSAAPPSVRNAPNSTGGKALTQNRASGGSAASTQAKGATTGPSSALAPARSNADDVDDWTRRTTGGGARTVVHESSLLSFPLLSTLTTRASTSTSSFTSTSATYSSMPLTAGAISGRRSYGGANVEIEKLNDPSSHREPATPSTGESKSALKKRLKAERDAETVSVRRASDAAGSTLSSAKTGKRTAALDANRQGRAGAVAAGEGRTKRRRTGDSDLSVDHDLLGADALSDFDGEVNEPSSAGAATGGFARPAGFEGARSSAGGKKGKARDTGADALLTDEGEHRWTRRGEMREWDEDKMVDTEEEEDEEGVRDLDGLSEDDDSDVDRAEETGPPAKKGGPRQQQKRQLRQVEVERALRRSEEARMAVGPKKRR